MTIQTATISPYSLSPKDTCIWKITQESYCLIKVALMALSVVIVPLELIGRLFANGIIAVYNALFSQVVVTPQAIDPSLSDTMIELIKKAGNSCSSQPLTQEICVLKTRGVVYGQPVGDALGLITEFNKKSQLAKVKPDKLEFALLPKLNPHRDKMFARQGWTDDTDQMVAIGHAEHEARLDTTVPKEIRFARHLLNWLHHGLNHFSTLPDVSFISRAEPNSGDSLRRKITCQDVGAMTRAVLKHPDFLSNPYAAALAIWKKGNGPIQIRPAANGALMRTSILGVIYRNNLGKGVEEAIRYAKVTHVDPRSIASAVALTVAIALLLSGANLDHALHHAETIAIRVLYDELKALRPHMLDKEAADWETIADRFTTELRTCTQASLPQLALDTGAIGYTFKCLGAAWWAAREAQRLINDETPPEMVFRTLLETIIFEGGDADTNAAVVGALLGAYLGEEAIPPSWRRDLHPQDKLVLEEAYSHAETIVQHTL